MTPAVLPITSHMFFIDIWMEDNEDDRIYITLEAIICPNNCFPPPLESLLRIVYSPGRGNTIQVLYTVGNCQYKVKLQVLIKLCLI